jgi:hypothetical protein
MNYSRLWDEEEIRRRKQSGRHPLRGAAIPAAAPAGR